MAATVQLNQIVKSDTPYCMIFTDSSNEAHYVPIDAYPDNATAVAAIGVGKPYYTDVAGEYFLKLTH